MHQRLPAPNYVIAFSVAITITCGAANAPEAPSSQLRDYILSCNHNYMRRRQCARGSQLQWCSSWPRAVSVCVEKSTGLSRSSSPKRVRFKSEDNCAGFKSEDSWKADTCSWDSWETETCSWDSCETGCLSPSSRHAVCGIPVGGGGGRGLKRQWLPAGWPRPRWWLRCSVCQDTH